MNSYWLVREPVGVPYQLALPPVIDDQKDLFTISMSSNGTSSEAVLTNNTICGTLQEGRWIMVTITIQEIGLLNGNYST